MLDRVIRTTGDPYARADALVQRLSALINLGRTAEFTRAVEDASAAVRDLAEPYLHGHSTRSPRSPPTTRARSTGA